MIVMCRHIYAHQDTRTPWIPTIFTPTLSLPQIHDGTPLITNNTFSEDADSAMDVASLLTTGSHPSLGPSRRSWFDTPTQLNIECDRLASETTHAVLQGGPARISPPLITYLLPGSRALLRIGDTWITSHARRHMKKSTMW